MLAALTHLLSFLIYKAIILTSMSQDKKFLYILKSPEAGTFSLIACVMVSSDLICSCFRFRSFSSFCKISWSLFIIRGLSSYFPYASARLLPSFSPGCAAWLPRDLCPFGWQGMSLQTKYPPAHLQCFSLRCLLPPTP